MTKDEIEFQRNIQRVATNVGVLLDVGLFPGKHAQGLHECQGFIKSIMDDATQKLANIDLTPPPAAPPTITPPPAPPLTVA